MIKYSELENSEVLDRKTNKKIRISTTVRLVYRKAYPEDYGVLRNARLNIIIAKDFNDNSSNVLHYFRLGGGGSQTSHQPSGASEGINYSNAAEIRGSSSSFFISAIKSDSIDILTIQSDWIKPKYHGSREDPIALGDF